MTDLPSLIARLREADGPSRELDAAVFLALGYHEEPDGSMFGTVWCKDGVVYCGAQTAQGFVTRSLDAAVALAERLLPGWMIALYQTHREFLSPDEPAWGASVAGPIRWVRDDEYGYDEPCFNHSEGRSVTPALALLIAILTAWGERQ